MRDELIKYAFFEHAIILGLLILGASVLSVIARKLLTKHNFSICCESVPGGEEAFVKVCLGGLMCIVIAVSFYESIERILVLGKIYFAPALFLLDKCKDTVV